MIVAIMEFLGGCAILGLLGLGVYHAVQWYNRRNSESESDGASQ